MTGYFENAVNDVPMNYIARTIEIDLKVLLGEQDLPEPAKPIGDRKGLQVSRWAQL